MTRLPRANLLAWGAVAVLLLIVAVRFRGGGAAADQPPPVRIEGSTDTGPASPSAAGSAPSAVGDAASGPGAGALYVHVAGAVARPGLYRVPGGSRVAGAVDAAGGPSRRADLASVNLAAPLQDGQQVVVPVRPRGGAAPAGTAGSPGSPAPGPAPTGSTAAPGAKLSLSTATVEQLDMLDGIGPTLARRIVEYRDAHGGFRSVDELREVEGIGEKRFESLREAVQP